MKRTVHFIALPHKLLHNVSVVPLLYPTLGWIRPLSKETERRRLHYQRSTINSWTIWSYVELFRELHG